MTNLLGTATQPAHTLSTASTTATASAAPAKSSPLSYTLKFGVQNELSDLYTMIVEAVHRLDISRSTALIFDDPTILLTIGVSRSSVVTFLNACQAFICSAISSKPQGSLVVLAHDPAEEKSQSSTLLSGWLNKYLAFRYQTVIVARDLSTGPSRDIHGEVAIYDNSAPTIAPKVFHFKVSDANVSFFPRGTASIVL
eukprot:m.143943 g.143943  ORF g.143943 m.143943 type:complete len:197 (-) comp52654_c0_seq8:35-625(-)